MKQFYMIYVWGKQSPVARHATLKKAVDEAERLRTVTENAIYILQPVHCLEGLEPPKSENQKARDKEWYTRWKTRREAEKAKKLLDEQVIV